ncbi:MAG: hypothetical protein IKI37_04705 [Oscillospiraceae bacterium]|nr:hypothetical protein [Oscillospiraceae bacterium]
MMIRRILDVDKFIGKLNAVYHDSMTELSIMPLGIENWMSQVAQYIDTDNAPTYRPKEKHEDWLEEMDSLSEKSDLASVIKELTVICEHYEEYKMDYLQTQCYRKALSYLVFLYNFLNCEGIDY